MHGIRPPSRVKAPKLYPSRDMKGQPPTMKCSRPPSEAQRRADEMRATPL
ncbi:hypothetical protein RS9916_32937 [Synechococcus sp. RS9916]|nr:hypothetical protein RS9916_32937 [Synechococcus sp. RS9916]